MKKILLLCLAAIVGSSFLPGCRNKTQPKEADKTRFALFIHASSETKPSLPLLIYTNENDTTYLQYCRMEHSDAFIKFPIGEYKIEHMKKFHVSDSLFDHISDFIIKNDTKTVWLKDNFVDGNYWVFFQDDTVSLIFALDGGYMTGNVNEFFDGIREFIPEFDE